MLTLMSPVVIEPNEPPKSPLNFSLSNPDATSWYGVNRLEPPGFRGMNSYRTRPTTPLLSGMFSK